MRHRWEIRVNDRKTRLSGELNLPHFREGFPVGYALDSGPNRHIPLPTMFHSGGLTPFGGPVGLNPIQ